MKNLYSIIGLSVLMLMSSCVTTTKTARTAETSTSIKNATVADLKVADQRITYTMTPSKEIQRAGLSNVKQAAIQEALTKNGNADVMVEPEFVISMKNNFIFGKEVTSITVTGRPAYYTNFRTLNDSVWSSPGFYGQPNVVYVNKNSQKSRGLAGAVGSLFGGKKEKRAVAYDYSRSGFGANWEVIGGSQYYKVTKGGDYKSDNHGYVGSLFTLGYNITSHWFLGVGSGFIWEFDQNWGIVPLYGDVRFNFSGHKRSTLFFDYKIGGTFRTGNTNDQLKGGLFLLPAVGYSFGSFEVALQWGTMFFHDNYDSHYYEQPEVTVEDYHFGLSIGLNF